MIHFIASPTTTTHIANYHSSITFTVVVRRLCANNPFLGFAVQKALEVLILLNIVVLTVSSVFAPIYTFFGSEIGSRSTLWRHADERNVLDERERGFR